MGQPNDLEPRNAPRDDAASGLAPNAAAPASWQKRVLPWLSMLIGIASAATMDRGPRRAALVAIAAVSSWLSLLLLHWLARLPEHSGTRWRQRLLTWIRRSSLMATQSAVQLGLFFAAPFYWQAARPEFGHGLFVVTLGLLSAATLWDPLTARLLMRPLLGPLLPAISSFVALNAVLPGLGLSTQASLWSASFTAAIGVALLATSNVPAAQRKRVAMIAFLPALLLPLALLLGMARIVPAAPLKLVRIEIGTESSGKWLAGVATHLDSAPGHLFCATAIASPVGVKDRLFHVWRQDRVQRARIELDIRGGRQAGYRTRSRLDLLSAPTQSGNYSCSVETASGQFLGSTTVSVGSRRAQPAS